MVLIACEESQVVTIAMREAGIEAFSCDLEPCSGGHPEWHIQRNVLEILHDPWDMIIAFPPCTHLANSGARWFPRKQENGLQQQAIDFFLQFTRTSCKHVAIENPIGIMSTKYDRPTQIVHPWYFGHEEKKATCLWLKGLPRLKPTYLVRATNARMHELGPSPERSKLRSKTYEGLAKAMAKQWGDILKREEA